MHIGQVEEEKANKKTKLLIVVVLLSIRRLFINFKIIIIIFIYISNKVTKEQLHKKDTEKCISTL